MAKIVRRQSSLTFGGFLSFIIKAAIYLGFIWCLVSVFAPPKGFTPVVVEEGDLFNEPQVIIQESTYTKRVIDSMKKNGIALFLSGILTSFLIYQKLNKRRQINQKNIAVADAFKVDYPLDADDTIIENLINNIPSWPTDSDPQYDHEFKNNPTPYNYTLSNSDTNQRLTVNKFLYSLIAGMKKYRNGIGAARTDTGKYLLVRSHPSPNYPYSYIVISVRVSGITLDGMWYAYPDDFDYTVEYTENGSDRYMPTQSWKARDHVFCKQFEEVFAAAANKLKRDGVFRSDSLHIGIEVPESLIVHGMELVQRVTSAEDLLTYAEEWTSQLHFSYDNPDEPMIVQAIEFDKSSTDEVRKYASIIQTKILQDIVDKKLEGLGVGIIRNNNWVVLFRPHGIREEHAIIYFNVVSTGTIVEIKWHNYPDNHTVNNSSQGSSEHNVWRDETFNKIFTSVVENIAQNKMKLLNNSKPTIKRRT